MNLQTIRTDYKSQTLSKADVNQNPILQFEKWMQQALAAEVGEANACAISTVNELNKPSSRIVLLKEVNTSGFVFFTNYESRKGNEMAANNSVSLLFFWKELERQVRIEGTVTKISDEESDAYFATRPFESQLGAWASPQSTVIHNRPVLETKFELLKKEFANKPVPRPLHWGGYRVKHEWMEFWQGRPSRLHDRISYEWHDGKWLIERLAP